MKNISRFTVLSTAEKEFLKTYKSCGKPEWTMYGDFIEICNTVREGIYEVTIDTNLDYYFCVMIDKNLASHILSPEAKDIGIIYENYICYDENKWFVPYYELLDKGVLSKNWLTHWRSRITKGLSESGYYHYMEYFISKNFYRYWMAHENFYRKDSNTITPSTIKVGDVFSKDNSDLTVVSTVSYKTSNDFEPKKNTMTVLLENNYKRKFINVFKDGILQLAKHTKSPDDSTLDETICGTYKIYQVNNSTTVSKISQINILDYIKVYEGYFVNFSIQDTLNAIYDTFNYNKPFDYFSDAIYENTVIVIEQNEKQIAYRCSFDTFVEYPEFFDTKHSNLYGIVERFFINLNKTITTPIESYDKKYSIQQINKDEYHIFENNSISIIIKKENNKYFIISADNNIENLNIIKEVFLNLNIPIEYIYLPEIFSINEYTFIYNKNVVPTLKIMKYNTDQEIEVNDYTNNSILLAIVQELSKLRIEVQELKRA